MRSKGISEKVERFEREEILSGIVGCDSCPDSGGVGTCALRYAVGLVFELLCTEKCPTFGHRIIGGYFYLERALRTLWQQAFNLDNSFTTTHPSRV